MVVNMAESWGQSPSEQGNFIPARGHRPPLGASPADSHT